MSYKRNTKRKSKDVKFSSPTPGWSIDYGAVDSYAKGINHYLGFTYRIENLSTGKFYYGQKKFWKSTNRPPAAYKNKKIQESDWRTYWSSCNELKEDLIKYGSHKFSRMIVGMYKTKWDMSYQELLLQINNKVVEPGSNSYNSYIGCRLRKRK